MNYLKRNKVTKKARKELDDLITTGGGYSDRYTFQLIYNRLSGIDSKPSPTLRGKQVSYKQRKLLKYVVWYSEIEPSYYNKLVEKYMAINQSVR
jgi:hypothetical protein